MMKTATEIKSEALQAWFNSFDDNARYVEIGGMLYLLAAVTSADKSTREFAKKHIREHVAAGTAILKARQDAAALASFANKHDPDDIAP